jgi:hypothetical protein
VARQGVDLVAKHKRNMRPHTRRERCLLQGHRVVESVFSSLDRRGLSERAYRKTRGLVFHVYAVLLAYGLLKLLEHDPAWRHMVAQMGAGLGAGLCCSSGLHSGWWFGWLFRIGVKL